MTNKGKTVLCFRILTLRLSLDRWLQPGLETFFVTTTCFLGTRLETGRSFEILPGLLSRIVLRFLALGFEEVTIDTCLETFGFVKFLREETFLVVTITRLTGLTDLRLETTG